MARSVLLGLVFGGILAGGCAGTVVERSSSPVNELEASVPTPAPVRALDPTRTRAVIAGVLTWKTRSLTRFDPDDRKDVELADALVEARGVPRDRVELLLDEAATREAILARLEATVRSAAPGDRVVFYYAGHGIRRGGGATYLASWDIDTSDPGRTGVSMNDLIGAFEGLPSGASVLLLGDFCYSGALREVATALSEGGIAAASLTSADTSNISTSNWTYTQAIVDGLRGDSLADRDRDGAVELGEMAEEVVDAMKHREGQRAGYHLAGIAADEALAPAGDGPRWGEPAGRIAIGGYAITPGFWRREVVRVIDYEAGDRRPVVARTFHYATSEDVRLTAEDLEPIVFRRYGEGTELVVEWERDEYDARVIATEGDFHLITYPGWSSTYDEWILSNRILEVVDAR